VAVDAVSFDLVAPCFEESSSGMVICMSDVIVESVVVLCEWAIESEPVGRAVSGFLSLKRFCFGVRLMRLRKCWLALCLEIWWFLV
jgi:hypothetical protein